MAEKKNKSVKKKAKKPDSKKTALNKKKSLKSKKTKKKVVSKKNSGSNRSRALPILLILCLLTVIVILVNNIYIKKKINNTKPAKKDKVEIIKNTKLKIDNNDKKKKDTNVREIKAKIYFIKFNEKTEKVYLASVKRNVDAKTRVKGALNELIKGLQPDEKKKGYLTAVPSGLRIKNIKIKNRTAVIDFNNSIGTGASGNILIRRIDQIVYTATQFKGIESIIITVNGKKKKTLGSDGLSIGGPLHRRR